MDSTNACRIIAILSTKTGDYPYFYVNDLRKDNRFNELLFVSSSSYLKFYARVPLITKRGIIIESLFIIDDRVWSGMSKANILFIGTIASIVVGCVRPALRGEVFPF